MIIEQAIFTSAKTKRSHGYQLVGRSPGVTEDDARELAIWGPSHDSLLAETVEPASTNFHRLASGAFCISRTCLAGVEYSGRGGARVYTQFLIVSPEVLVRFSNNPFAIVRATVASGAMSVREEIPEVLEPIQLAGRAPVVDLPLLAHVGRDPGPAAVATFLQAALASDHLAVAAGEYAQPLLSSLFSLLPVECRTEFSFSTGLKFSPSRSFRVSVLPSDQSIWRAMARHGVTLLDLAVVHQSGSLTWEGWPGCVAQILGSCKLSVLAVLLDQPRPWLNSSNLHLLSDELQAALEFGTQRESCMAAERVQPAAADSAPRAADSGLSQQRADGAHTRRDTTTGVAANYVSKARSQGLAEVLAAQSSETLELLERIDDLVNASIAGDERAFGELEVLWPLAASELDEDLVEQSREQYLRCALSIWTECVDGDFHRADRAASAIDVICVLFED